MPGCAAKHCKNSSRQGVKMNRLPRNATKRKKWIANCKELGGMKNWSPLDTAALCEYHFTADKWEKPRVDGKKKLKCDAVPTIFGDFVYQVKEKFNKQVATDVDTKVIFAQTDPSTKDVNLLSFSNEGTCEAVALITATKQCELPERMDIDNTKQNHHPRIEDNLQQNCSVEVDETPTLNENLSTGVIKEQTSLLNSENNFQRLDSNSDILEKYRKLEKLYLKNERLRLAMKKRHSKIYKGLQTKIKSLETRIMCIKASLENLQN